VGSSISSWHEAGDGEPRRETVVKHFLDVYRRGKGSTPKDLQWPLWYCNSLQTFELAATKADEVKMHDDLGIPFWRPAT